MYKEAERKVEGNKRSFSLHVCLVFDGSRVRISVFRPTAADFL
jgi:hypothetical protein